MNRTARRTLGALATTWLVLTPFVTSVAAQDIVSAACLEPCPDPTRDPGGAATCVARVTLCSTKLNLYQTYMGQLGAGVALNRLPQLYIDILQPLYIGNLHEYQFGFGDHQPPNNATTDCTTTYFNHAGFVEKLRNGNLDTLEEYNWLFHEMRHFSQCQQLGGRDRYAKAWFANLELAAIQNADLATLHDRMPMESEAEAFAMRVRGDTAKNRDVKGHLVKPIALAVSVGTVPVVNEVTVTLGGPMPVTATVTGGSDPIKMDWGVKAPGAQQFQPSTERGRTLTFTPTETGTYEVFVSALQENSNLEPARKVIRLSVGPARQMVGAPLPLPNTAAPSTSLMAAQLLRPLTVIVSSVAGQPIQASVCVGDAANPARYARGVADSAGRVTLQVLRGAAVQVTVSTSGFTGAITSLTMGDGPQSVPVTLRPGRGGPACS